MGSASNYRHVLDTMVCYPPTFQNLAPSNPDENFMVRVLRFCRGCFLEVIFFRSPRNCFALLVLVLIGLVICFLVSAFSLKMV